MGVLGIKRVKADIPVAGWRMVGKGIVFNSLATEGSGNSFNFFNSLMNKGCAWHSLYSLSMY